jgi:hypothetical protein
MQPVIMKKQKGYIALVLVIFAAIIGILIFPIKFPQKGISECTVGEPPNGYVVLEDLPAIKDIFMAAEDDFSGNEPIYGGPDPVEKADYVLIRRKVPTGKVSEPPGWDFLGGSTATDHTHTINIGELPEKPGFDAYYPSRWGEMDIPSKGRKYIRNMGLILFANNDPSTIKEINGNTVYLMDVYQDKRIYDLRNKGYSENDIFICGVDTKVGSSFVVVPGQDRSQTKDQLQLEWFVFSSDKLWGIHCKPAVYLYPEKKQLVNVKVNPKGELSFTDPPYDSIKGWTVWANPTGRLHTLSEQLIPNGYLYYESKIKDSEIKKPTQGWVVKFEELGSLYDDLLPKLGLNGKEAKDFSQYWLKALPDSPYYFVGLINKDQRDYLETLSVTPSPETSIRFSFYFEPLDKPISVKEPEIITPKREGFTLVDWGGMVKLHPGTPFTCSQ